MENKNSHKAIFILDNIALRLYNITVKENKYFTEYRKNSYKPLSG